MGPRLLLVEDEPDTLAILTILLEAAGYSVTAVGSADAAIAALERTGFDLVITDLLLDQAGAGHSWARVDQIVALAHPAPVGLLTGWQAGLHGYAEHGVAFALLKPVTRAAFIGQLASTLKLPPLDDALRETLRAYFSCIENHAYDQLQGLCADDVVYRLPGSNPRFANEIVGLDDFIAFTRRTFEAFDEPRFGVESMRALPHGALVEYTGSWREGDARRSMPGAVMFELDGARIKRIDVRVDADVLA